MSRKSILLNTYKTSILTLSPISKLNEVSFRFNFERAVNLFNFLTSSILHKGFSRKFKYSKLGRSGKASSSKVSIKFFLKCSFLSIGKFSNPLMLEI